MSRMSRPISWVSCALMPATGSSRSSSDGSTHSARAMSTCFWSPWDRSPAGTPSRWRMPRNSAISATRARWRTSSRRADGKPQAAGEEAGPCQVVPAEHQVLLDRRVRVQGDVLEGACDPQTGDLVWPPPDQLAAGEPHRAALGPVDAAHDVEQRRLAGPVRTDDRVDRRRRHPEGHVVEGRDAGEADGDRSDLQSDRRAGPAGRDRVHGTHLPRRTPSPPTPASSPSTGRGDSAPPRYRSRTRSSRGQIGRRSGAATPGPP